MKQVAVTESDDDLLLFYPDACSDSTYPKKSH